MKNDKQAKLTLSVNSLNYRTQKQLANEAKLFNLDSNLRTGLIAENKLDIKGSLDDMEMFFDACILNRRIKNGLGWNMGGMFSKIKILEKNFEMSMKKL